MSNLKCGTKGYSGPTCKEADFPECKEIGGGYNYKKLYRKGAKPTTSKSKYSAKYKQMKSISGNGAFWSANPLATGVCRVASKKNPTRSLEWYAFEPATAPQPAAVPTAPAYTNGVYDSQPEDEGDPTFAERADRMLKDAVKYYDAKFTKLEESDFDPKVMLDNFWKEAIAVAGVIVAAITIKLLRGRSKKRKAALAKEKRLAEKKKARMAEEKARAAEQRMLEAERETIEARKAALDAERKAMEAERASPVPPPPEEPVALTQIKSTSSSPKQAVPELPPPETPAETEAIVLAAPEVKVAQDPAPVVRGGLEVVDWGDGDSPGERETIEMRVSENRASAFSDTLDDLMKDGTQEPDKDMVEWLLVFDPPNEDLKKDSDLRAIETGSTKKIPEDVVKRAGLITRFVYKPEGFTFQESLTEILERASEIARNGKVTYNDVKEAAVELRIFDDLFKDRSEMENVMAGVAEIEEEFGKEVPRELIWKARLIISEKLYVYEGTPQQATIQLLQMTATLASKAHVIREVDLVDGVVYLSTNDESTSTKMIKQLERRYEEGRVENFKGAIRVAVESHSKWVSRRGYHLAPVDASKATRNSLPNGRSASTPARSDKAIEAKVVLGDSVPNININEMMGDEANVKPGEAKPAGRGESTVQLDEVPEHVLAEAERINTAWLSNIDQPGSTGERSMSLEFDGFPQQIVPVFKSLLYFEKAEAALERYVRNEPGPNRIFGRKADGIRALQIAFRTVLSEVKELKAYDFFRPEEDVVTLAGFKAATSKLTAIEGGASEPYVPEPSTVFPSGVQGADVRAMVRESIEANSEFRVLNAWEKSNIVEMYTRAIAEIQGFAEIHFVNGRVTAEGYEVAKEFLKGSQSSGARSGAKKGEKPESKRRKGATKADDHIDLGEMFKDGDLDGIVDPKKAGK